MHICDPLDESAKCFSENSRIFPNKVERQQAMNIALEYGSKIVKNNQLGYADCQTTIIFENNCPNNNLPILWATSKDSSWLPLFKRF